MIGGLFAYKQLNIEAYPDPVPPLVDIVIQNPGQSSEEIERYITIPIEVQMSGLPYVTSIRTISLTGLSDVKVQFTYDLNYRDAAQLVINRLNQLGELPNGAQPILSPTSPIGEIYRYRLVGPQGYSITDLKTIQDWILERRFKAVPGVIDVTTWGGITTQFQLELEPEQPNVLNYLGYSWADQRIHLDRALPMIERAVELLDAGRIRGRPKVVLTFDDASASHHAVARPLLKRLGFGATFFITEGFTFRTNKRDYLTWEQIAELHRDGFEIGNHTRDHLGITEKNIPRLAEQLEAIAARCREHGIPAPVSFAWPGNKFHANALPVLEAAGIRFARRGGEPEVPYAKGGGVPYEPGVDHPLLIPTTADARPVWTLDHVKAAVAQARDGRIAVLQFHGVPDGEHPWVNTPRERFEEYMAWLHAEGYTVIALRDLARYVEEARPPADPIAVMRRRGVQSVPSAPAPKQ